MSRTKITILVLAAVSVLAFDVWFFMGGEGASAGDAVAEVTEDDAAWSDAEEDPDTVEQAVERIDPGADVPGDALSRARWLASAERSHKRQPLEGVLRTRLMMRAASPITTDVEGIEATPNVLDLTTILWDIEQPTALIAGRVVREGEIVDGFRVARIEPRSVWVTDGARGEMQLTLSDSVGGSTGKEEQGE
ncbi:MAG: hypothetical protein GY716_09200 [bacterium]|nr:hypothetical protein [bacterium]